MRNIKDIAVRGSLILIWYSTLGDSPSPTVSQVAYNVKNVTYVSMHQDILAENSWFFRIALVNGRREEYTAATEQLTAEYFSDVIGAIA